MKPGPKGPSPDVIEAVVDMKQWKPTWGCTRIAQQMALAFGIAVDKDVVRRILAGRYQPTLDSMGPTWLAGLGHTKDSLWSLDLFWCESATLRSHWVLLASIPETRSAWKPTEIACLTRRYVARSPARAGNADAGSRRRIDNMTTSGRGWQSTAGATIRQRAVRSDGASRQGAGPRRSDRRSVRVSPEERVCPCRARGACATRDSRRCRS